MPAPRVLVLSNEPTLPADHPDAESEHDILYTADQVARILQDAGLQVARLGVTADPKAVLNGVKSAAPDAVFNLYEGTAAWGNSEAYVAGVLELLRVPYTGSPPQPLILARSKPLTKQLLAGAGLPTAGFRVVESLPVPANDLGWPVIVKPGKEDASVGIDQKSVVTTQAELDARAAYILDRYGPPVLVERFVRGREFNVAVWERDGVPTTLPFSEILFLEQDVPDALWPIVSFDAKWHPNSRDFKATPAVNPAEVSPELHAEVRKLALDAFALVGCRDYARVDFRVDETGRPFVLEVNPNPCISPLAGLAAGLEAEKVAYSEFILSLVRSALRRGERPELADAVGTVRAESEVVLCGPTVSPKRGWKVRPAAAADLDDVLELLAGADALTADERAALIRTVKGRGRRKDWGGAAVLVLAGRARLGGVAVVAPDGPAACRLDALVMDPSLRRAGWGRQLASVAEKAAAALGGRFLLAAVTAGPTASAARQFLAAVGYGSAGEVPDFYPDGASRLQFAKRLPVAAPQPAPKPAGVS